ncbi:MAG TPA: hypothetical protein VGJ95_07630 [Pseudonocardiaceae bacterium]
MAYFAGDPWLADDTIDSVKPELVLDPKPAADGDWHVTLDIAPAAGGLAAWRCGAVLLRPHERDVSPVAGAVDMTGVAFMRVVRASSFWTDTTVAVPQYVLPEDFAGVQASATPVRMASAPSVLPFPNSSTGTRAHVGTSRRR